MTLPSFVVTGIPRSGTSLFSTALNRCPDVVCLNEIHYDARTLRATLEVAREQIRSGVPLKNKFDATGRLTTDTAVAGEVREWRVTGKAATLAMGSKVNVPYLLTLDGLLAEGFRVIALVRDPVDALASWRLPKTRHHPEAMVAEGNRHPRWAFMKFQSSAEVERQAEVWGHLAGIIDAHRDRLLVVRYEDFTRDPWAGLAAARQHLGLPPLTVPLDDLVKPAVHHPVDPAVQAAVAAFSPRRAVFGYGRFPAPVAAAGSTPAGKPV